MKVYRIYGTCHDWECQCERTIKVFNTKEKAENFLNSLSKKDICELSDFCRASPFIDADIEILEIE